MKVLIAYPNNVAVDNPFVRTLKDGLEKIGCDISWVLDEFMGYSNKYDIIHIQWPNPVFEILTPTDIGVLKVEKHIAEIKKYSKLVYTRHNERPHYTQNQNVLKCYKIIEQNSDAIVHLGAYGIREFKEQLQNNNNKHFVIPHHIYEEEYDNNITQKEAREKLNIPPNKFVVLTFGAYRDKEEAEMVLSEFAALDMKHKFLLAPRLKNILMKDVNHVFILNWLRSKLISMKLKKQKESFGEAFVSNDLLPYYFSASDVVLIQRKKILNSGNIPMAFFFKKLVVGANVGNVGELLIKTNNMVFNPNETGALCETLKEAEQISSSDIGENNYIFAIQNMNIKTVAKQYLEVYKSVLQ